MLMTIWFEVRFQKLTHMLTERPFKKEKNYINSAKIISAFIFGQVNKHKAKDKPDCCAISSRCSNWLWDKDIAPGSFFMFLKMWIKKWSDKVYK